MFHIVFWFIKQIYYILKRFTKYKILLLAGVGILVYVLLSNHVFGYDSYTVDLGGTIYTVHEPNSTVLNALQTIPLYNNSDYFYFTRQHQNGERTACFIYKPSLSPNYRIYTKFSTVGVLRALCYYIDNDTSIVVHSYGINNNNGSITDYGQGTINANSLWVYTMTTNNTIELMANCNIYYDTTGNTMLFSGAPSSPYIVNSSEVPSWSFTNNKLLINTVSLTTGTSIYTWNYELRVVYDVTQDISFPINSYILIDETTEPSTLYFNIPINLINNYFTFAPGKTIHFYLNRSTIYADLHNTYDLGSYTLTLTQAEADIINSNTQQEQQANDSQSLQSISTSLNDSSVDFSLDDLPQDSSEDITRDGINNIFSSIYNAFCTGSAQNIVLPIPFTSTTLTIPANLTRSVLETMHANIIINIIEALWWYIISRFIIKDILNKITKIKSGNIEHLQDDNIKGDML